MPGDVDSASGLDGEKEDHETSNLKDVLRRKLQAMQRNKAKKSEELASGSFGKLAQVTFSHRFSCQHFTSHFKALSSRRLRPSYSVSRSYACGAITRLRSPNRTVPSCSLSSEFVTFIRVFIRVWCSVSRN